MFGNRDSWTGLGVFFNTYDNTDHESGVTKKRHQHPYVYGMVNDGSIEFLNVGHADAGCHVGKSAKQSDDIRLYFHSHSHHTCI